MSTKCRQYDSEQCTDSSPADQKRTRHSAGPVRWRAVLLEGPGLGQRVRSLIIAYLRHITTDQQQKPAGIAEEIPNLGSLRFLIHLLVCTVCRLTCIFEKHVTFFTPYRTLPSVPAIGDGRPVGCRGKLHSVHYYLGDEVRHVSS